LLDNPRDLSLPTFHLGAEGGGAGGPDGDLAKVGADTRQCYRREPSEIDHTQQHQHHQRQRQRQLPSPTSISALLPVILRVLLALRDGCLPWNMAGDHVGGTAK
ncbi:unnamed protein product, partial [Ectocarpus sp. 12 AP-2014]